MHDLDPRLRARIETLLARGGRRLLGIAGAPGSGKSTLAARVAACFGAPCRVVPMDGFHLAQAELERLGRASRKGAPDTFDAGGYVALLARLRGAAADETVYAPEFRREIEEPIANSIPVGPEVRLVVTEGNYLLMDGAWARVRELLDESWFVATDEVTRGAWLLARHMRFGRSREAAEAWIAQTDTPNAKAVAESRPRATLEVEV